MPTKKDLMSADEITLEKLKEKQANYRSPVTGSDAGAAKRLTEMRARHADAMQPMIDRLERKVKGLPEPKKEPRKRLGRY